MKKDEEVVIEVPPIDPAVGYALVGDSLFILCVGEILPCPTSDTSVVTWVSLAAVQHAFTPKAKRGELDVVLVDKTTVYLVDKILSHSSGSSLLLCDKIPMQEVH